MEAKSKTNPRAKSKRGLPKKLSFRDRAKLGHFGDLRLLGLSGGIVLLCVLGFILVPKAATQDAAGASAEAPAVTPPVLASAMDNGNPVETDPQFPAYDSRVPAGAEPDIPGQLTPEQRERRIREMAENIPECQVLLW